MSKDEMFNYVETKNIFIDDYSVISTGWNTIFTLSVKDSSILDYLKNNNTPIVYSDNEIIVVKF